MSSANLPSSLSIPEHGNDTQEIDDPDLVAKQLQDAAFEPAGQNKFEKRREAIYEDKEYVVATAEINESSGELEISARDHVGVTSLTPNSSLEIEPKIDWDQVFNVFLKVHKYDRAFKYHGIPIENFLADDKDLSDIYIIVAANYLQSLQPILRNGLIRSFESKRIDAVDAHGKIDIQKSIWNYKSGTPKQHFITKEPKYDIPVNSLIHLAGKYLLYLFQSNSTQEVHQGYYSIFSEVKDKVEYLESKDISSRLSDLNKYRHITIGMLPSQRAYYQDAIEISKTILSSATGRPLKGGEEHLTMDYLINMDQLFQEYSQIVLEEQLEEIRKSAIDTDWDADIKDEPSFRPFKDINTSIEPDHVVLKDSEIVSILDTKYYSSGVDPTRNSNNRNQMYKYSSILDVDEMAFICPASDPQERTIEPSGRTIRVISPGEFTTQAYEQCVRDYLEETLDVSTEISILYKEYENGIVCKNEFENISLEAALSSEELSTPLDFNFVRDVQKNAANISSTISSYEHVKRKFGWNNKVYSMIKKAVDEKPNWTNTVIPILFTRDKEDDLEEHLHIRYVECVEGAPKQTNHKCIRLDEEWG